MTSPKAEPMDLDELNKFERDLLSSIAAAEGPGFIHPFASATIHNNRRVLSLITEIRALRAAVDGQGWVACGDALPERDLWVLAVNHEHDYVVVRLAEQLFSEDNDGPSEPYWAAEGGDLALCNYPFWMPLPSPPVVKP